mmetsp:Transcript_24390/g.55567  ORF Transcript_24390/g.55567 Transcript_24390/m.55567 type:complete len:434 (+) Transcript_24390:1767-3068(+)
MVSSPGHLHSSPSSARADIERESFPPSIPIPSSCITSRSARAVSYMSAPSPGSFEAHIQLPSALMSSSAETLAQTMLVTASPTDMRALASPERRPLMGCSPMAVTPPGTAVPSLVTMVWAMTAQSARGVRSGPTHCCCAMSPVTERSTLLVRKRLEPTVTLERTRSRVVASVAASVRPRIACITAGESAASVMSLWSEWNVLGGSLPSTWARGRLTGVVSSWASWTMQLPSPVIVPTQQKPERSRSEIAARRGTSSAFTSAQLFSWYSAPQSSRTDMVSSPQMISRISILPPTGSMISLSTLQFPPHPWSWRETMGLRSPRSTHARITRFIFCSISASPRCTALKSRSARPLSPSEREEAAPPPTPMRYAGPPSFTTFIPTSGSAFLRCRASICPNPPVKSTGLTHSRRSPPAVRIPKERVNPQISGSPNLFP